MHSQCVITSIVDEFHPMITFKQNKVFRNQNLLDVSIPRIILLTKHVSFMGSEFLGSHLRLLTSFYTFTCFHRWKYISPHVPDISPEGVSIPTCYYSTHFHFHVSNRATLLDFVQWYRVHQSITKHGVHSYHALTPMSCDVPMHKCNLMRHCMSIPCHIYDECYMDNLIYAYTMYLKQL